MKVGQAEVYDAIRALGGQATYSQIRDYLCARGYCENSIHGPLRRLKYNRALAVRFPSRSPPVYVIHEQAPVPDHTATTATNATTATTTTYPCRQPEAAQVYQVE